MNLFILLLFSFCAYFIHKYIMKLLVRYQISWSSKSSELWHSKFQFLLKNLWFFIVKQTDYNNYHYNMAGTLNLTLPSHTCFHSPRCLNEYRTISVHHFNFYLSKPKWPSAFCTCEIDVHIVLLFAAFPVL